MAGEDFFKFNNGKEFKFSNFKEIKEKDLKGADERTKQLFNIFAGDDKILQADEALTLFNALKDAAGDNKTLETNEIKMFTEEKIGEEIDNNIFVNFVNNIFKPEERSQNQLVAASQTGTLSQEEQTFLEEAACKEIVIDIIDDNLSEAYELLNTQYLGAISGRYDESKDKNDILKTSNVAKILDYQNAGIEWMNRAKLEPPNGLTKKEYYEGNKERIKDMILTRFLVLDTNTKFKELKDKYSEEELAAIIGDYVETLCSNASMEDLKNIQKNFVSLSGIEEVQALEKVIDNAIEYNKDKNKPMPTGELAGIKINQQNGIIPDYWNTDEPVSFEEVYKIERGTEYSQYKIEKYALAKKEMEIVANAYNKKQQFIEFAEELRKDETLSIDEKAQKVLEGFADFYVLSEDAGLTQLKELINKSKFPISIDENGFNFGTLDDSAKNKALNSLLKLAQQSKETEFEEFLNGKTIEDYQIALAQAHDDAIGEENGKLMAEAMKNDNLTCIQRWTGNTSMVGMGMTVVGGILCFTPLAPLGAGMVTAGNTLAIGGMVAETGLGVADYATKDVQTAEEAEQLGKNFLMNAGGFIIGMGAGKAGMKAFSNLIDEKLVAVFGKQIAAGNKAQALKTVFTNPKYLKNFMTAAGAKLSADFVISYAGDLAMMGILDTQDDWQSLLKANLTGILVGMSGDIKDVSGVGRVRNLGISDGVKPMTEMDYGQRLLGNDVTVADPKTGATVKGKVTGLHNTDGQVEIEINGQRYSTNDVAKFKGKVSVQNSEVEISIEQRLQTANDRESFVAIRDEIKKLSNGEEKTQLMQKYLKIYNEWSSNPSRPDIRMQYKFKEDPLNQNTDEVRTIINNTITRLRQTSNGEDITLKINGEEQVYQAYKGNISNNGSYYVTDGENIYTILPKQSRAICEEKILANELYSQLLGCFPKEETVVETDTGYAIMSKSIFSKVGFTRGKAAVRTYALDALLGNMENVVLSTKDSDPVIISNNAMINLLHHPNGNSKMGQSIVPELSLMFQQNGNNAKDLKSASKEELVASLQQVVDIPNEKLLEIVNKSQVENKEQLGDLLIKRKEFINNFLNNLKNTEQAGLPIEEHILKVYQKSYAEYSYDNLKTNTGFTEFISKKFDIPKQDLLGYQKILNNPELAQHITEKINDGLISKEDLIEFNEDIGNFQYYWQESPTLQKEIFDALIDLKNEQGINIKAGYILVLKIAQNDRVGQFSKDAVEQIKTISTALNGNTNAGLYRIILNDGTIDKTKLDLIKYFQSKGIDDKYLVLLTEQVLNPNRTINNEKLTALKELFDNNIKSEDIPMYFTAINTPEGFDANMVSIIDKYKELGLDNENITRNILSSRVRTKDGFVQKTYALELPLLFLKDNTNAKLLNIAVREFSLWTPSIEDQIKSAVEKNPNIKLADLVAFMQTLHKTNAFDSDGFSTGFRLLQDGVTSNDLSSFISVSKITANQTNNLTPEEALKQTIRLRSTGEILLDHDLTPTQAAKLLNAAKTDGKIDKFALDIIENQFKNYTPEDLLCLIDYSKVLPQDGVPLEVTNTQRQQILDNITDIMKNKGYSVVDACKSISPALNLKKEFFSNTITGINENILAFCKRCIENDIEVNDILLIAHNSRILDNVSNFSAEEINAKQQQMLNWAEKLLYEDKLSAKTVAKLIDTTAFKTQGKIGVRPATYNFDDNVIKIIDRMIDEKAITQDSSADISKIILAFKTLDYDDNAIAKTIDLLKNPITLKNGKQYDIDAESIGYFIGGSKNKETGRFDIDKFNRNVDIYILKADYGFTIQEMFMLSKLYKNELTVDRLSTAQKVNLLNKISYASKDAIELIQDKVIDTKDSNGSIIKGDIEILTRKLLTDINLASKNVRTNQSQRQEFLRNFISNKGKNSQTVLNNIETKISQFDFTQYGKYGLPLKYSRNEFIANIREILADLTPEEQASVLRFHNIDLGENGFNSNPRVKQINQPVEPLTNEGYKNVIDELSTILKGVNEDNLQLYKENNIETILKKCIQLSQLNETQIAELVRDYPELKLEDIKTLQTQARGFAQLVENNDVGNLPTPLAVKTTNEEIEEFNQFTDKMKSVSAKIEQEYNKFIYENEFKTGDAELDNILNGIMRGLPDVILTVGKQQHKTHAYSVDVHTMEVLKKAMNDPEYKTLSDKDRTILKFSILLHDFGKKYINPETPDTGHEIDSAEIASGIMAQFKLPATVKERILNIIKNHDWFARYNRNEWNANKVAALFRSPDDYKIAKIMSKADLFSINSDFQYRVLNINENRTIENAAKVFDQRLENLDAAYQKMYAKTNIVMNSKILNTEKIPMDEQYGVRVLNLTDENIPSDTDLGQYGMNGTTKDNLRLTVHMVADDNLLGNLESAKLGMESTINDNNVWSISMIKMDRTRTYMHREYGFVTDTPISSIAIASPNNLSSGYEKGTDKFVELLFTDNPQRNFLKQKFMQSAHNQGCRISEADYQELSKLVYNKSFLTQIEKKSEIEVNGNVYPASVIVKAIQESTDALFTGQTHTEFVAANPKIQGLVVRKNSMDEVVPEFIAFAKKYNLPILLVGNK